MPPFSVGTPTAAQPSGSLRFYLAHIQYIDATHIFDGLDTFPTHVAHMRDGAFVTPPLPWNPNQPLQTDLQASTVRVGSNLHALALSWLREDRELRLAEEKSGKRMARGPKASDVSLESGVRRLMC